MPIIPILGWVSVLVSYFVVGVITAEVYEQRCLDTQHKPQGYIAGWLVIGGYFSGLGLVIFVLGKVVKFGKVLDWIGETILHYSIKLPVGLVLGVVRRTDRDRLAEENKRDTVIR